MSQYTFKAHSLRAAKAQAARFVPPAFLTLMATLGGLGLGAGILLTFSGTHAGMSLIGLGIMLMSLLTWIHRDLDNLPPAPIGSTKQLDKLLPTPLAAHLAEPVTPAQLWHLLTLSFEGQFMMLRFGLNSQAVDQIINSAAINLDQVWLESERISSELGHTVLQAGTIVAALFAVSAPLGDYLTALNLSTVDLNEGARWASRVGELAHIKKPLYGGLARDWASGFTPQLARFGTNLSQEIELAQGHLTPQERTAQLNDLVLDLGSAAGSVVLVGEPGIGKSALLLGLAERLLQGKVTGSLAHYQIYSLSAATIIGSASAPGDIERLVTGLLYEAARSGNIILALDEAQLFFGQGTGAVNLSQLLLPLLQSRQFKMILAVTPGDWQKLKAVNAALTGLLTPLMLLEPNQETTLRILADRALYLDTASHIITYTALRESYNLSGRYFQEEAYPGKALKLLEGATNHPVGNFITEVSVQQTVESQFGVKVQAASAAETDVLLHLEDKIHERMINQSRAVSVVANALRRSRAGVSNPRRPIGSFLFLGPTGVGKTELSKSLAALYFGAESNIIRLDMSEYQQPSDASRLLVNAEQNAEALLPKIRQNPFSVVLFDEIEKAHPNVLNLFLQLLDEGNLTDSSNHPASFKDAIIIATSNAGADDIRSRIEAGEELEAFEKDFINNLIDSGSFKPELLNRFDEIVLFRPLNEGELIQVVKLMVAEVNKTLTSKHIKIVLTDELAAQLASEGYDPRLGARPMRRMVTRRVEDKVAEMILRGEAKPGQTITLS
ncbi:MAG: hypothetical protein NVSMB39_3850 [Candidatus Saccharimonadales bacterium]